VELFYSHFGGDSRAVDLFCSHGGGQTSTVDLFCSHGGQTVELWTCSVFTVDRL
jgi:hypothetical protein